MGGVLDEAKKEAAERDVAKAYKNLKGICSEEARIAYLSIVRGCKMYGAQYFMVQPQVDDDQADDGNRTHSSNQQVLLPEMILAVTSHDIVFIDPETLSYGDTYSFEEIKSWGYSDDAIMLEMSSTDGNSMWRAKQNKRVLNSDWYNQETVTKKYYYTRNPKVIADLLKAYNMYYR